jgi:hypothetical protein
MTAHLTTPRAYRAPDADSGTHPANRVTEMAVGRFLRALHILLRSTHLYHKNHPLALESLEAAEQNLRSALQLGSPLEVRVDSGAVRFRGRALADQRGELKALAETLEQAGVANIVFLRETHIGELSTLAGLLGPAARSAARSGDTVVATLNWAEQLEMLRVRGIRVNCPAEEVKADAALTRLLAAVLDPESPVWARPDEKTGALVASATGAEELCGVLRLFARVVHPLREQRNDPEAAVGALRDVLAQAEPRAVRVLVGAMAQAPQPGESLESYVSRLAEGLVMDLAAREFRSAFPGETPGAARRLRDSFARLARELLAAGFVPRLLAGAGPSGWSDEACADFLYLRFWNFLGAPERSQLLRGPEAWCVPASALRAHVEEAVAAGTEAWRRDAGAIVQAYTGGLSAADSVARLATAAGLSELRPFFARLWPQEVPRELCRSVIYALIEETAPEVAGVLSAVTDQLAQLALDQGDHASYERLLHRLETAPRARHGDHLASLAERLLEGERWETLVEAGLANRPLDPCLPRILGRDPERLLDGIGARLSASRGLERLPAMARLVRAIGEPVLGALVARLFDPRSQRATVAVKLLCATRPERLVEALPRALPYWDWNVQDLAVADLIRLHPPGCAEAFLEALPQAHPLVVPMLLDDVGLRAGELRSVSRAVPVLTEIAAGLNDRLKDVFVRIKAIEALGRIGPACGPEVTDLLRTLLRQRNGLTHSEPAGLRAAAEEALGLIENRPSSARVRTIQQAVVKASACHARARRYLRIPLESPLPARIDGSEGSGPSTARVRSISLGGAFLESSRRLSIGDSFPVEFRTGLRRIRSMAVVRNVLPNGGGVEFVHMKQDDREKLRRLISRLTRT